MEAWESACRSADRLLKIIKAESGLNPTTAPARRFHFPFRAVRPARLASARLIRHEKSPPTGGRSRGIAVNNRLLVAAVDDDEVGRESLPDLLRGLGFAVQAFQSGEDFLASEYV